MMLFAATLVALVHFCSASSSSSTCIPYVPSTTPVPGSVATELSSAYYYYPSIYSVGTILSTIDLSSPTFSVVESVIDSYEVSYSTLIDSIESIYASPWLDTDSSAFSLETQQWTTLASVISYLVSVESSHPSLASVQTSLQYVFQTDSSILTDLYVYTEVAYPTVYSASSTIDAAELTSPSIFDSVVAVTSAISAYSSVSYAMSYVSYEIYYVPYSVYSYVETLISSSSTVSATVVTYLESYYPTLYSYVALLTDFTYLYPSIVSDVTGYISVAYSYTSLGSAVSTIISYQMPTLSYEISVISYVVSTWTSAATDMSWLSGVMATSSTISSAISEMEASFYSSPSVASIIYSAIYSPSTISNPSSVSSLEASHLSLVTAVSYIISWESDYPSYSAYMSSVVDELTYYVFPTERTFTTAVAYVSALTSASTASASNDVYYAETVVSSITTVLSYITYVTAVSPSFSCYEDIVESYALTYPSIVYYMWSILYSPSTVASSSVTYYAVMEDSYSTLFYAMDSIVSDISYYPALSTYEYYFISAVTSDSSLLTAFSTFTSATESAYTSVVSSYSS